MKQIKDILSKAYFFLWIAILCLCISQPFIHWEKVWGLEFRTVLTGSMQKKYPVGTLLVIKQIQVENLCIGDIIAYQQSDQVVTHRIVEKKTIGFVTKGDSNRLIDQSDVLTSQIIGKAVVGVPYIGQVALLIQTIAGKIALLLTGLNIFLLIEFIKIVLE